ncbi:hypothetical protein LTR16_011422, partial [Cryomyces antarcticus]
RAQDHTYPGTADHADARVWRGDVRETSRADASSGATGSPTEGGRAVGEQVQASGWRAGVGCRRCCAVLVDEEKRRCVVGVCDGRSIPGRLDPSGVVCSDCLL